MNEDFTPNRDDEMVSVVISYTWVISRRLFDALVAGDEEATEWFDQDIMTDVVHGTTPDIRVAS